MKLTTTIKLNIHNQQLDLTKEEARELYNLLGEIFGTTKIFEPYTPLVPYPDRIGKTPQWPTIPPIICGQSKGTVDENRPNYT